jgi:hypothetical protein
MWNTHAQNADRLQDDLCPLFDVSFAALLDDLDDRGLLAETLVVAIGEFGRTPKINKLGGRDHWGPVFSCALAGAGIAGGQVFGASDRDGAYPAQDPIRPHDLTATIYHLLGIPSDGVFHDRFNRPQLLTKGEPLFRLLGDGPATTLRCAAGGDESFVPPYTARLLDDTDFQAAQLLAPTPPSRHKGWRAHPLLDANGTRPCVWTERHPHPHVRLGIDPRSSQGANIPAGTKILLAQEIRSARGGHYQFTVHLSGQASSRELFDRWFADTFACRLTLFRFLNTDKNPLEATELAGEQFRPQWREFSDPLAYSISKFLGSTIPGTNFAIGNGLGVALVIEATSPLEIMPGQHAVLELQRVQLEFNARVRDDSVTV